MTVSAKTQQALRDAMERLLSGRPEHTDGKLSKNNLCREAGVSRATMNRATEILTEWDARTATSPAGVQQRRRDTELAELRSKLRKSNKKCRAPQDQVDAAATVIMTLLAENSALREQVSQRSATVAPLRVPAVSRTRN
ncbi:hypothetical protein [Streptomyces sp. NPDC059224]|uniref:hypothetical protein n=1 Tax=Streptomyces sp. NPDC059224 TaxID=3346775 RepID=UPI00367ABA2E